MAFLDFFSKNVKKSKVILKSLIVQEIQSGKIVTERKFPKKGQEFGQPRKPDRVTGIIPVKINHSHGQN